jgi:DNA-3-methyladenine glycosylase
MIVFTFCEAIVTDCYSQCGTGRRDEGCDHGRVDRSTRRLERAFFEREVTAVAKDLLGRVIVSGDGSDLVAVRLTEVEAYRGLDDSASHAFRGPTPRTSVMFGPGGHLYTYFVYGMHWCANIVTGPDGNASAVLLRAGEVVDGVDLARSRRPTARADRFLARGPAGLATVLGLDGSDSGADLCLPDSAIRLHASQPTPDSAIRTGPRVGVATAADLELRFWIANDPTVSAFRAWTPRGRSRGVAGPTSRG